ncbi:SDR family oxidoreductase [Thalassovita sp.]|uniref:SDR family oxidoreductase n=1 Tax=Thalassovita sp. TaxID=1979401 RepID=UPI0029DE80B6|nr:SDR family oxidoreductase [Thalassovita sp.]
MKTIIVTGASAGIGAACARIFLEEGWRVGLLARRAEALAAVADGHGNAVVLPCDVTNPAQVDAAFDSFVDQVGRLDVLFNNAGMFGRAVPIDELSIEEWRQVRDVNLDGMFLCARAAFGRMRRQAPQGGRIINNGSISAHAPREGSVSYTTTKHAITGLTKTLSLDGRPFDIACGQIDIGNARTELLEGIIARNPDTPPPTMDVADVARAVLQMAQLGPEANVQFMTIMATKMPYIGRG